MPRVVQVIESIITRGKGDVDDHVRNVFQYHSLDGELLAERDPFIEVKNEEKEGGIK